MNCRITEMHNKEVINVCDGTRLGCVDDVEVDTVTARLVAIVVHGRPKMLGILGRDEDMVIPWNDISVIGEDTILVNFTCPCQPPPRCRRRGIFSGLFCD